MNKKAFTLIEMLAVVAVMVLIAGILMPAVQRARVRAQITRAKTEVHQIVVAWKCYYDDYRTFEDVGEGTHDLDGSYMDCLAGSGLGNNRGFVYMEFDDDEDGFYDPWNSHTYKFAVYEDAGDMSADGARPRKNVAAWSYGPDLSSTTNDNVRSWEY